MITFFGTRALGPRNLSVISLFWFFNRAHYSDIMPYQLESFKLVEKIGTKNRSIMIVMLVSVFLGILATFWVFLHISYKIGLTGHVEWFGWGTYNRLQYWINNPSGSDYSTGLFLGIGFITAIFFAFMRNRFFWWPFHPAGYAVSSSWGLGVTWLPILIGCTAKYMILKYGGLKAHRQATPFFSGLILGEFIIGSIWSLIGLLFKISTYAFWVN